MSKNLSVYHATLINFSSNLLHLLFENDTQYSSFNTLSPYALQFITRDVNKDSIFKPQGQDQGLDLE